MVKNETLRQKQSRFVRMVGQLIQHADSLGYSLTFGDAYRDPRHHGEFGVKRGYSAAKSLHKLRLAIDFNLFDRGGAWLSKTEDFRALGEYWESIGGAWGGRFGDGNHFSLEHGGAK